MSFFAKPVSTFAGYAPGRWGEERMRRWVVGGVVAVMALAIGLAVWVSCGGQTAVTAARFAALRDDHTALRAFLRAMPKGADLHVHLSGAVFAEDLIAWAAQRELCIRLADMTIDATQPCNEAERRPPIAAALRNQALYDRIVNALSMRGFVATPAVPTGHDQFFATFARFGAITNRTAVEMTVERLRHYAADGVQHAEFMVSILPSEDRRALATVLGDEQDFARRLEILKSNRLDEIVAREKATVDAIAAEVEQRLDCAANRSNPGCGVSYNLIAQVSRGVDEKEVFVQTAFSAALIRIQPLLVALNFVGPEDYRIAREDYRRHMQMIGFLARDVPVALHAGELWGGLVPPDDLTFHIREAIEIAGAKRIGHGVALAYERRSAQLLEEMRKRNVAVEINLTSNDVILGVRGKDHPLTSYLAAGVPVVLSTDDAGVSRIDLSNEYFRAARDYPLGYRDLKRIARNSIEHAFLDDDARRNAFAALDSAFEAFEQSVAREKNVLRNTGAVIASWFR
jgi:adenosine deaminase